MPVNIPLSDPLATTSPFLAGQYRSRAYPDVLVTIQAHQSISRRGNCYDSPTTESAFGTLNDELIEKGTFCSAENAHIDHTRGI